MTNTTINYEGGAYQLIKDAYLTNYRDRAVYETTAICTTDTPDGDGWQPYYKVRWEILPEYAERDDWADESGACDWDNPDEVEDEGGAYNVHTGQHC